jgi:hypothetical protein
MTSRQVRVAAWDARLAGLRARAEAHAAHQHGNHAEAARQHELADSYQALHDAYRQREDVFAVIMADRAGQGADLAASQAGHPAVRARLERAADATPIWRQPIDCGWFTQRR